MQKKRNFQLTRRRRNVNLLHGILNLDIFLQNCVRIFSDFIEAGLYMAFAMIILLSLYLPTRIEPGFFETDHSKLDHDTGEAVVAELVIVFLLVVMRVRKMKQHTGG